MRRNINIAVASVTLAALAAASGPVIGAAAAAPTSATTSSLAAFTLVAPTSQVPSGLLARAVIAAGAGCPLLTGTYLDPASGYPQPTYGPLANPDGTALSPLAAPYPAPTSVWTDVRFGYVIATPKAGSSGWLFDQRDQGVKVLRNAIWSSALCLASDRPLNHQRCVRRSHP